MLLIYILIIIITNFFGIFNILEDYRIPGVAKPSDIVLMLILTIIVYLYFARKPKFNKVINKFIKIDLLIVAYVLFLIIYSSYISHRDTFNEALRVGGIYLYYISFIFPFFLFKKKNLKQYIYFLRIGGMIVGAISIISALVGYSIVSAVHTSVYEGFTRIYLPRYCNYFVIMFWLIQKTHKNKLDVKIYSWEFIINLIGLLLFFKRIAIISLLLMILLMVIYLREFGYMKKTIIVISAFAAAFTTALLLGININLLLDRIQQGYYDIQRGESTLNQRFYAIAYGYTIFKEMPVFGTGFIMGTSDFFQKLILPGTYAFSNTSGLYGYPTTSNIDFGLVSILFTTGIVGFSLITYFIIKFIMEVKKRIDYYRSLKQFNTIFTFSLAILIMEGVIYFVEQIAGGFFMVREMALHLISMAIALKLIYYEISPQKKVSKIEKRLDTSSKILSN